MTMKPPADPAVEYQFPMPTRFRNSRSQTALYDAAYGHNAGANVDVVTLGGSNQFHGSLFEFFRNEALNANDYFFNLTGQPRPVLRQNQYGFTGRAHCKE